MRTLLLVLSLLFWVPSFGAEIREGGLVLEPRTIESSGGLTVLSTISTQVVEVVGSMTHTVQLPDAANTPKGWVVYVFNRSASLDGIRVVDDSGNLVRALKLNESMMFSSLDSLNAFGRWGVLGGGGSGGGLQFSDLSVDAPLEYDGEGKFSIPRATITTDGYLAGTDYAALLNSDTQLSNRIAVEEAATVAQGTTNTNVQNELTAHESRLDDVEQTNLDQDQSIADLEAEDVGIKSRLVTEESKSAAQATYNSTNDSKNTAQDGRLTAVETKNTEQDTTLTDHGNRLVTLESAPPPITDLSSTFRDVTMTGHGFQPLTAIRYNGTTWVKSQANSAANAEVYGIVAEVYDANSFKLVSEGRFSGVTGLTPGTTYYLSAVTPGALAATSPTTVGQVSKAVLNSEGGTSAYVVQSRGYVIPAPVETDVTSKVITQTAHGFTAGKALRHNGTAYVLAQADSDTNAEVVGIVSSVIDANTFKLASEGYVSGLSGLTPGATYRLSAQTAGTITTDVPMVSGQVDKPVFNATSATAGYIIHSRGIFVGSGNAPLTTKGDIPAFNGTTTVRLPVGNQGEVLTADPSTPTGLVYKKAAAAGTRNYVQNASGETDATTGITAANTTVTRSTTVPYLGDTSELQFTIDSATDRVTFALDAFPERLKNGFCSVTIPFKADLNGDSVRWEVWRVGGTTPVAQGAFYTPGGSSVGTAGGNFPCGDLTAASELRIQGTNTNVSNLRVANVQVSQAEFSKDALGMVDLGSVSISGATFGITTTTYANLPVNGGTVVYSPRGGASVPSGTNLFQITVPYAPAGRIKVSINGAILTPTVVNATSYFRVTDGTLFSNEQNPYHTTSNASTTYTPVGGASFYIENPTEKRNVTYTVQCRATSGACAIGWNQPDTHTLNVEAVPSGAAVLNVKNQSGDYDPVLYYPTFNGGAGFNNVYFMHERKGKFLRVTGQAQAVTMNGNSAYFGLPSGLEIDFDALGSVGTYNKKVGEVTRAYAGTASTVNIIAVPGTPSQLGLSFDSNSGQNALSPQNWTSVFNNNEAESFRFEVPIKGWSKSSTSTNIAGEPGNGQILSSGTNINIATANGAWNSWAVTGQSVTAPTNNNLGTIVAGNGGGSIGFTPKETGPYEACPSGVLRQESNNGGTVGIRIVDEAGNVLHQGQNMYLGIQAATSNYSMCVIRNLTAGTLAQFNLQGTTQGTGLIVNMSGFFSGTGATWTIKRLSTTVKMEGGDGDVKARVRMDGQCNTQDKNIGVASTSKIGTSYCQVNFATSYFSAIPTCTCSSQYVTGGDNFCTMLDVTKDSMKTLMRVSSGTSQDGSSAPHVVCFGNKGN